MAAGACAGTVMRSPDHPHWKMMVSDSFLPEFTGVHDLVGKDLQGIVSKAGILCISW